MFGGSCKFSVHPNNQLLQIIVVDEVKVQEKKILSQKSHRPTAVVFLVFITGFPVITKWGDYSTFNIPRVVLKVIQQLWEC